MRAISFDFWHTLFTEQPRAFEHYRGRRHRRLAEALEGNGKFSDDDIDRAFSLEAREHHRIWIEEQRTLSASERLGKILDSLGARLAADELSKLASDFEEGILERPPVLVDGARDAVEALAADYKLGIISDVGFSPGRVLRQVLAGTGLLNFFDSLVFSDEAGRAKPHAEMFNRTARALGVAPREIVHVGDLEHTDVVGAKNAGWHAIRFIGVTPMLETEQSAADRVTARLADLLHLIGGLT
ncbi:MAG TPA: HAD family hydrolase [Blastocatellia bacterium]|nr:HAD family hydrolase [Blastocatellia bacterium]